MPAGSGQNVSSVQLDGLDAPFEQTADGLNVSGIGITPSSIESAITVVVTGGEQRHGYCTYCVCDYMQWKRFEDVPSIMRRGRWPGRDTCQARLVADGTVGVAGCLW